MSGMTQQGAEQAAGDRWSRWLLDTRFGGSDELRRRSLEFLGPIRDRVLTGADLRDGDTVLDVGCGDGLLGFAALDLVGPTGQVIFSDVSPLLLETCRGIAAGLGALDRCRFVPAGLPELAEIPDRSVDVAVLRSVLIYVSDKAASLRSLRRVLRPGGRLSLFEPINSFGCPEPVGHLWGYEVGGLEDLAERVKAAGRAGRPTDDPISNFDERDLLDAAVDAGFTEVRLSYEARIGPRGYPDPNIDVDALLQVSPNPNAPTYGEMLDRALSPAERARLLDHLGAQPPERGRTRWARAFLSARSD